MKSGSALICSIIYAISLWMTYETRLSGFTVCIVALLGHVVALLCKQLRLNRQNWWLHLILGVKFLSALARWRFHTDVRDFHCGIRGITREAASRCMWTCPGMEFATEMIAEAVNQGSTRVSASDR